MSADFFFQGDLYLDDIIINLNTSLLFYSSRLHIGEATDTLTQLEGDLTAVQDSNYEASNHLSSLEREAKELNLSSEKLNSQLEILKNSNFLGEPFDHTGALVLVKIH